MIPIIWRNNRAKLLLKGTHTEVEALLVDFVKETFGADGNAGRVFSPIFSGAHVVRQQVTKSGVTDDDDLPGFDGVHLVQEQEEFSIQQNEGQDLLIIQTKTLGDHILLTLCKMDWVSTGYEDALQEVYEKLASFCLAHGARWAKRMDDIIKNALFSSPIDTAGTSEPIHIEPFHKSSGETSWRVAEPLTGPPKLTVNYGGVHKARRSAVQSDWDSARPYKAPVPTGVSQPTKDNEVKQQGKYIPTPETLARVKTAILAYCLDNRRYPTWQDAQAKAGSIDNKLIDRNLEYVLAMMIDEPDRSKCITILQNTRKNRHLGRFRKI